MNAKASARSQRWFPVALVLVSWVGYAHLFASGATPYSRHSDWVAQHLAMKQVAHASLQRGEGLPLWKRDMHAGGPALTHPQALFTQPLQAPLLWWEPARAAGPTLWLHFLTFGLAMWVLGGTLGLGAWARAMMGLSGLFAFKMIAIAYAGWWPVLPGFVCAPLLFAAVFRALDRPGPRAALALAAAGWLALHGGHVQILYYAGAFLAVHACAVWLGAWRTGERSRVLRSLGWCAVGSAVAVAASAYLWLPLAADLPLTSRAAPSYAFFQSRGAWSPALLATFLWPEALGSPLDDSYAAVELWEDVAYFGIVPLLFAFAGAAYAGGRHRARFFAVGALVSVALVFDTPLQHWLFELAPGFALFRHPSRFLFLTTLLAIPLAGIGVQVVHERLGDGRGVRLALAGALLLVVVEGGYWARRYVTMAPIDAVFPRLDFLQPIAADPDWFRVAPLGRSTFNYGWASLSGVELVTAFDAYNYRRYEEYLGVMTHGRALPERHIVWTDVDRLERWDLADALDVKYLITRAPLSAPPAFLRPVGRFDDQPMFAFYEGLGRTPIHVYRNLRARPRVWWAASVTPASDAASALEKLLTNDLRETAIVETPDGRWPDAGAPGAGTIRALSRGSDRWAIETRSERDGFAVIGEIWHPGWRATLDGQPLTLYATNLTMLGAQVPAGAHRIELAFAPLHWDAARAISAAGAAGGLGLALLAVRRRW